MSNNLCKLMVTEKMHKINPNLCIFHVYFLTRVSKL